MAFDIKYVRDDLLRKLSVESPANAPAYIRQDVATAIVQAVQTLALSGGDYFLSESISVSITAGNAAYVLDSSIQRVPGPVRLTGGPHLRVLRSRGEYDSFGMLYQGAADMDLPSGQPRAYFLDLQKAPSGADASKITLRLVPVPIANDTVQLEVIKDATHYNADSFCEDPTPVLPVPHKYVETLLLPLARFFVTRSHWFKNKELLPELKDDYTAAMVAIGLADPAPPPVRKTKPALEEAKS